MHLSLELLSISAETIESKEEGVESFEGSASEGKSFRDSNDSKSFGADLIRTFSSSVNLSRKEHFWAVSLGSLYFQCLVLQYKSGQAFSLKGQIVNILGLVGHISSQLCVLFCFCNLLKI